MMTWLLPHAAVVTSRRLLKSLAQLRDANREMAEDNQGAAPC